MVDIRFHLKRNGMFLCFDRYGDSDDFFLGEFNNPFLCRWDKGYFYELKRSKKLTDKIVMSVNDKLFDQEVEIEWVRSLWFDEY